MRKRREGEEHEEVREGGITQDSLDLMFDQKWRLVKDGSYLYIVTEDGGDWVPEWDDTEIFERLVLEHNAFLEERSSPFCQDCADTTPRSGDRIDGEGTVFRPQAPRKIKLLADIRDLLEEIRDLNEKQLERLSIDPVDAYNRLREYIEKARGHKTPEQIPARPKRGKGRITRRPKRKPVDLPPRGADELTVEELWSPKTYQERDTVNRLKAIGIKRIGQLTKCGKEHILRYRGFGPKRMEHIERFMKKYSFSFKK